MTMIKLGYVALSLELQNASPSRTMTYAQFQKIADREAAIHKLERIALENLHSTLRLLRHNIANEIHFYRMTSRLLPLATHEALDDWDYMPPLLEKLGEIGDFVKKHHLRVDFHPDHFVLINSLKQEVLKNSLKNLNLHRKLLRGMKLNPVHRCVMHVGGNYKDTEKSLERFVDNWMLVPRPIQEMIMLENDDTSFTLEDTLYLCEKLEIPLVFDYHHHLAHHRNPDWQDSWERVIETWNNSPFPVKMHISSPKDEKAFRHHSDYVDVDMFFRFLNEVKGSVPQIDCMIEAKKKDQALFRLAEECRQREEVEMIDASSFLMK